MGGLITVRIPEELQLQMKKYDVNWSDKVRTYLEMQVRQMELLDFLKKTAVRMKHAKLHADSAQMIKEDRESR
jgi:hypothetical protein